VKKLYALFVVALLALACGREDGPVQAGEAGSRVPLPDVDVWLSITDSIGIEMGDSTLMLGMPAAAFWMPENRVVVLDMQKFRASIFTPEGEFIASLGRQGSGPGEFLLPSYLSVTPSGGIAVCDAMAGHLSFFSPDLEYTGSVSGFFPSPPVMTVFIADSVFIGMKPEFEQNENGLFMGYTVARWNISSPEPEQVFYSKLNPFDISDLSNINFTEGMVLFAATSEGVVYTTVLSTEAYEFNAMNPDGSELFSVTEPFTRVRKTQEDIDSEREFVRNRMRQGGAPEFMVNSYQPDPFLFAIGSMGIAPDGNLWVAQGVYGSPVFRVYNPATGEFLFTAALEVGDEERDITVMMNRWGFTGIDQMSGDWPRVYIIDR